MRPAHSWRSFVRCSRRCATSWGSSWSSSVRSIAGKSAVTSSVTFGSSLSRSSRTTPFRHRHRRAATDLGHDRELVHQPPGAGKSQPEPVVRAVAVGQGLARRRRCPGRCPWATTRTPVRGSSTSSIDDLAASRRTARCCGPPRRPRSRSGSGRSGRSPGATPAPVPPGARRRCPRRRGWGCCSSSSRGGLRSISGWLSRAHRSHSSRWRPASTSRCRRRSPPDRASRTGRHRSVGGSMWSRASRYSTRSRARVRFSWAATAPGGGAQLAGQRSGVLPGHLVGEQRLALALGQAGEGLGRRPTAPPRRAGPRPAVRTGAGRRCGAGCAGAGPAPATAMATTLRAVTMAYGSSIPGSTRSARGEDAGQGLLHEVVSGRAVGHARGDDAPHHRDEGGDVVLRPGAAGRAQRPLCLHRPDATPVRAGSARREAGQRWARYVAAVSRSRACMPSRRRRRVPRYRFASLATIV